MFTDAQGREWSLVDKAPIFGIGIGIGVGPEPVLPSPAAVRCVVRALRTRRVVSSTPLVLVSAEADGVAADDGTAVFLVRADLLGSGGASLIAAERDSRAFPGVGCAAPVRETRQSSPVRVIACLRPSAEVPLDDLSYLTTEVPVLAAAHPLGREHRVGEAVHPTRGRLAEQSALRR
ncbi:hypothetical protein [Micromonospora sp. WMMA2032]|uniref:hypothetical protein n=1 Tax=Micromonospora sp. WMMA2032 TaxID=2039870 RepID=UPI001C12CADB|nr:hypothetical protein [Micromonospora sp. WMMA2032]